MFKEKISFISAGNSSIQLTSINSGVVVERGIITYLKRFESIRRMTYNETKLLGKDRLIAVGYNESYMIVSSSQDITELVRYYELFSIGENGSVELVAKIFPKELDFETLKGVVSTDDRYFFVSRSNKASISLIRFDLQTMH